jgi:hypothetical protein
MLHAYLVTCTFCAEQVSFRAIVTLKEINVDKTKVHVI